MEVAIDRMTESSVHPHDIDNDGEWYQDFARRRGL